MNYHISESEYQDECDDLRYEEQTKRRYNNQLIRHPDPRDPDHPEWIEDEEE